MFFGNSCAGTYSLSLIKKGNFFYHNSHTSKQNIPKQHTEIFFGEKTNLDFLWWKSTKIQYTLLLTRNSFSHAKKNGKKLPM